MQNVHFTPPQLAQLFDVNVSTIKRWVDQGIHESQITAGGHRRITQQQLSRFSRLYPKHARSSYVLNRLARIPIRPESIWRGYYSELADPKGRNAESMLGRQYIAMTELPILMDQIVGKTLEHIGNEWADGRVSIYEEHRMTFLIRQHLSRLGDLVPFRNSIKRHTALLACVAGDQHELPLQMLALILKNRGWTTHLLGINISTVELLRAAQSLHPSLICLSNTYTQAKSLEYLLAVHKFAKNRHIHLWYGGRGWGKLAQVRHWSDRAVKYFDSLEAMDQALTVLNN